MKPLTKNQNKILNYIERNIAKNTCPSQNEMADHFGLTQNSICQYVTSLKKKGYLEVYSPHRGLRLTKEYLATKEISQGLSVVGRVAAGWPILAQENITEYIDVGNIIKKTPKDAFILQVAGDSMVEDGIINDDYVIVKPQNTIGNGQIGIVLIDDEATIKRVFIKPGKIILKPANPKYKEMVHRPGDKDVRIIGLVIGSFRRI
ncbi:MAG: repressor LexA [Ignavibacteria bacterium GWF2_33_9]|nr:MAG: repressor LexA [Ignavibacteria bacterium GWF2_33_9]